MYRVREAAVAIQGRIDRSRGKSNWVRKMIALGSHHTVHENEEEAKKIALEHERVAAQVLELEMGKLKQYIAAREQALPGSTSTPDPSPSTNPNSRDNVVRG